MGKQLPTAYPPRAMRAERAAAYLDISPTSFLQLVADGVLPKPVRIRGMVTWDRLDLDSAYDDLKDGKSENTLHKLLREPYNPLKKPR
jgi:predicted DNA-binding transcriptional regulator AlpA